MFRPLPLSSRLLASTCCLAAAAAQSPLSPPAAPGAAVSAAAAAPSAPAIDAAQEQIIRQSLPSWPVEQLESVLEASADLANDPLTTAVSDELLKRNPRHVDALRERLGVQLRAKQAAPAQETGALLVTLLPADADAWAALADAHDLSADHDATSARQLATALEREKSLRGATFTRHDELAAAWEKARRWDKARDAWLTVAAFSGTSPTQAREAWDRIDDLEDTRLPFARVEARWLREDEGTLFTLGTADEVTLIDDVRITLFAESSWLTKRAAGSFWGEDGAADRQDYRLGLSGKFAGKGRWAASGGVSTQRETRGLATAEVGWTFDSGASIRLSGAWNDRAEDSLPLIWLDGRQHKVELRAEVPLGERLSLEVAGFWREVEAEGERVGSGGGVDATLELQLWKEGSNRLAATYEWEWRRFDLREGLSFADNPRFDAQSLVLEHANRHRGGLQFTHDCGPLTFTARASAGYRFDSHDPEFSVGTSVSWRLSERSRLSLGYDWDSASRTSSASGQSHTVSALLHISL